MNLGKVIQDQWAADATLNGLLASTKVMTELYFAEDPTYPYATIRRPGGGNRRHYNDDAAENLVRVEITIYDDHGQRDRCKEIADQVQTVFNRAAFNLSGSDKCLHIDVEEPAEVQDESTGEWQFVVGLNCLVYLAAGV